MTDDLVKRLRQIGEGAYVGAVSDDRKAAREAADHIEKLEMAARGVPLRDMAALSKALDHIEKLEAALQAIIKRAEFRNSEYVTDVVCSIAREALEGKDE